MDKDYDQVIINFDTKAIKIFFSLFESFKESANKLNRQKDENVFQQQLAKYQFSLKEQLENISRELIEKNKSLANKDGINKMFADKIHYYLNEFRLKSTSTGA